MNASSTTSTSAGRISLGKSCGVGEVPPPAARFVIGHDQARAFAARVLRAAGLDDRQATDIAEVLVWTSLRGVDTHGVRNLKRYYLDWLADGTLTPTPQVKIEFETPLTARIDAGCGVGIAAACFAMRLAIDKARAHGMGAVAVRNSHHLGAAGYYAHMAVPEDMIGCCLTGYLFGGGNHIGVLPTFGATPMFSTNPLAIAAPAFEEPPFVLDMATSTIPFNRIEALAELGQKIPADWGRNQQGQATQDPAEVKQIFPLGNSYLNGSHKGYGLAVVVSLLSALLSGAWTSSPAPEKLLGDRKTSPEGFGQEGVAHFFAAMRIDSFTDPGLFKRNMDGLIRAFRACPPAEGAASVLVAGEIEHACFQERSRHGIPLPDNVAADLRLLSERFGVPLELSEIEPG